MSESKCPHCGVILTVTTKSPEAEAAGSTEPEAKAGPVNKIQKLFPTELQEHHNFEQQNSNVIITPHHDLGTEDFVKIKILASWLLIIVLMGLARALWIQKRY